MLDEKDLKKIDGSFNKNLDQRFTQFEEKVDQKFDKFEDKVDKKFSKFENSIDLKIKKELKPIKADVAKIRTDVSTLVGFFDSEIIDLRSRVEVIEEVLNLRSNSK